MNNGFRYFPEKLYSKVVRLTNITAKAFGMSRPTEIFYTVKNGLFNDLSIWETVSGRTGRLPTASDDVYIKTVVLQPANTPFSCFNMFITGTGQWDRNSATGNNGVNIFGNLKCTGKIGGQPTFNLYGVDNFIDMTRAQDLGLINYSAAISQPIMPIAYNVLGVNGSGFSFKSLTANTTCQSFSGSGIQNYFDIGPWDFTCEGAFTNFAGTYASGNGYILFKGLANFSGRAGFIGAPTIEFRNSVSNWLRLGIANSASGFGQVLFTTNSQSITNGGSEIVGMDCPVIVSSGITLTVASSTILQINVSLNGVDGTSSVINRSTIYFNNVSNYTMATGVFDKGSFANTVGYIFNGSGTLPFTTYSSLYIAGTGTKTQASGTNSIAGTLTVTSGAIFNSAGDTTVSGLTTINLSSFLNLLTYNWTFNTLTETVGRLTKTGAGSVVINGLWTATDAAASYLDFSGNPTVELKGGLAFSGFGSTANFNTGTGLWSFTTNNQTIAMGYTTQIFACPMLIVGAITVTFNGALNGIMQLNNSLNGTVAGSTFLLHKTLYLNYAAQPTPMFTAGVFNPFAASTSILGFIFNGDYTLPYTTFNGLVVGGTGTKTLLGNTTVTSYTTYQQIPQNGIFDFGAFDFTNSGITSLAARILLMKSGPGNILFTGVLSITGTNTYGGIDFSGNPNVEFRGGISNGANSIVTFNTGAGTWNFTTNNQTIAILSVPISSNAQILISGAITITSNITTFIANGSLNGNNAASKLDNRNSFQLKNAAQPMITGLLETNAAANNWKYNLAGNQDVKGGTYRTIEFGGSGVKTLQGNVIINVTAGGSQSTTGTASVNLNGFTITTI